MAAGKKTGRTEYDSLLDAFCKKHPESAILYLNFLLRYADDEGFVPSFSVALSNGYAIDNLRDLEKAGLIVTPEPKTGISAIVYWNIISDIKPCRKKETIFQYEKSLLVLTDNNAYKKRVQKCTDKSSVQNGVQKCVQNCTQNDDGELNEQSETADKSVVFESVADSSRVGADTNAQQSNIYQNESNTDLKQSRDPKQSIVVAVGGLGDSSPSEDGEAAATATAKKHRKRKPRGELFEYGEFCHVLLSDEEYASLKAKFGEDAVDSTIKNLDGKIENDPRKYNYKNHALTVRNWVERDIANGYIRLPGKQKSKTDVEAERAAYQRDIELSERNAFKFS